MRFAKVATDRDAPRRHATSTLSGALTPRVRYFTVLTEANPGTYSLQELLGGTRWARIGKAELERHKIDGAPMRRASSATSIRRGRIRGQYQ